MVHVYMLCIYVGKTTLPLLHRLRKHHTTAAACAEDSSFHDLLRVSGLAEWTPIPLQFTTDENLVCFLERDWWYRLKHRAINDCAPAVHADHTSPTPPPQHSKRIHALTRQLQIATQDRDYARKSAISKELQSLAAQFQMPLIHTTAVRVPYLTGMQTPAITRAITRLVQSMPATRAQRQAVRARIVIVRTVPLNVRCAFETHSNKSFGLLGCPPCTYNELTYPIWAQAGPV